MKIRNLFKTGIPSAFVAFAGRVLLRQKSLITIPVGVRAITLAEAATVLFLCAVAVEGQTSVLTNRYDNARTGQSPGIFAGVWPGNLDPNHFGKLFSQPVDGQVYGQPLYMDTVTIPGKGSHSVVFVVTEADSVYAFNANNNAGGNAGPLWKASLIDSLHGATQGARPAQPNDLYRPHASDAPCSSISPYIGITSTPIIDPSTGTMYVEAESVESGGIVHRLHALDVTTGNEKAPGHTTITGANFAPSHQLNRPGLLLSNGTLYIGFGSNCDIAPYRGFVFAYDAATFVQKGVYTVPTTDGAGIWMSGAGPAADDARRNLFVATGNGTANATYDLDEGILQLSDDLSQLATFTPNTQQYLDNSDLDQGSGGVLLLPDQILPNGTRRHLLVQAGKDGTIYLIDRDQMPSSSGSCNFNADCQEISYAVGGKGCGSNGGCMWGMPAFWDSNPALPSAWRSLYIWGTGDVLKAFPIKNGTLSTAFAPNPPTSAYTSGFPNPQMSISTSFSTLCPGGLCGIVWALKTDAYSTNGSAVLQAYDAYNLQLLYSSNQKSSDDAGRAVKFSVPTAVGGYVYVGAASQLSVYGLLPPPSCPLDQCGDPGGGKQPPDPKCSPHVPCQ